MRSVKTDPYKCVKNCFAAAVFAVGFFVFGAHGAQAVYPVAGQSKFLFKGLLFTFFIFFAGLAFASPAHGAAVYYSVGQNTTSHETGAGNVTVSGTTATFTVAQTATNMGVGDVIDYDTDHKLCYISAKTSTTVWSCTNATGGTPTAATDVIVNSISHVFNSLSAALPSGAGGAKTLLGNSDLTTIDVQLNIPCYYDSGADTTAVTIDGWTTDVTRYIKVYTPNNTVTEVNQSQRHAGEWDDGKFRMAITSIGVSLSTYVPYTIIDGLQVTNTTDNSEWRVCITIEPGSDNSTIKNSIAKEAQSITAANRGGIWVNTAVLHANIYNNIAYDFSTNTSVGIYIYSNTYQSGSVVYNNTAYNCARGFASGGWRSNILKNNLSIGCADSYYLADSLDVQSSNNGYDEGADPATNGIDLSAYSDNEIFVDPTNKDFHLQATDTAAKNSGANLYADANLPITTDIDGQARPNSATLFDIGADEAATQVFYSVGQSASDLKTGSPTVTITSGAGVFSAAQTGNIGVGDRVTYNTNVVAYIAAKTNADQMHWTLVTATGGMPADITTSTVVSITHEFTSLSAAITAASNSSHINNTDLTAANVVLNIPCYYDSGADTTAVTVSGYTTGASNYIKIYTPFNTATEANNSQRHQGKWDDGKYSIQGYVNNRGVIDGEISNIKIEGIQVLTNGSGNYGYGLAFYSSSNINNIEVTSNILKSVNTGTDNNGMIIWGVDSNVKIQNNITYGFTNVGIYIASSDVTTLYNNTIYNSATGVYTGYQKTLAKNNIVQNCSTGFVGEFYSGSGYNVSYDTTAPGTNSKNNVTVQFVDATNKDFHLSPSDTAAKNSGVNLQSDPYLHFSQDIDGQERSGMWDIGADEMIETQLQTQQASPSLDSGLVGHWTMDGKDIDGTTAKDISGNNNNGTISSATVTPGKLGQGMNFSSAGNVVNVPDSSTLDGMAQITIGAWIYPRSNGLGTVYGRIIEKDDWSTYKFLISNDNLECNINTTSLVLNTNPLVGKYNQWHHVDCIYDGSSISIYIDGVFQNSTAMSGSVNTSSSNVAIGNKNDSSRTFDGIIDDVRIYNRALSVDEVGQLYRVGQVKMQTSQNSKSTSGLVGEWSFDGPDVNISTNTAYDRSGQGNNGTISGATPTIGKIGQALSFNGHVSNYVAINSSPSINNLATFSVSLWVKFNSLTNANADPLNMLLNKGWNLRSDNSGQIAFWVSTSGVYPQIFSNQNIAVGNWYHISAVYHGIGTNPDLYINGVSVGTGGDGGSGTRSDDSGNALAIGSQHDGLADNSNAIIDEVRVYNRELSATEIANLYNTGKVEVRK